MTTNYRPQLKSHALIGLIAIAFVWIFPFRAVFAACMLPVPTASCEFLNSDAVFVGTVVSIKVAPARGDEYAGWLYNLKVQELFRGPHMKTIQVFTEASSGEFPLDREKTYLIFAYEYNSRLEITNCGNSCPLSNARPALRELQKLQIPKDAVVEGNISLLGDPNAAGQRKGVGGVRITVRSDAASFNAVTDRAGWFHVHVPPGTYSARVEQVHDGKIVPWGLSEDPSYFEARGALRRSPIR